MSIDQIFIINWFCNVMKVKWQWKVIIVLFTSMVSCAFRNVNKSNRIYQMEKLLWNTYFFTDVLYLPCKRNCPNVNVYFFNVREVSWFLLSRACSTTSLFSDINFIVFDHTSRKRRHCKTSWQLWWPCSKSQCKDNHQLLQQTSHTSKNILKKDFTYGTNNEKIVQS